MKELTIPARILVVDDEPGLRKVLCNHLGHEGYKVVAVASGGAAVEMLSQDRFDLVITDLVMQGGDGYAVMEHIERQ